MAFSPKNVVMLTCGLVADPEVVNGAILKMRVGVDFAGNEKDSDNSSGYFDVTYFYKNDNERNASFVKRQVEAGNFKKGTQIQLVGRLVQERWETDGKKNQRAVVIAEVIDYAGGGSNKNATNSNSNSDTSSQQSTELPAQF